MVLFEFFYKNGLYINQLIIDKGFSPNQYAYFITIILLGFLITKVLYIKFPKKNSERLINFYTSLANTGNYTLLMNSIIKYNLSSLILFIKKIDKSNDIVSKGIYYELLLRRDFIESTYKKYSIQYLSLFKFMKYKSFNNEKITHIFFDKHIDTNDSIIILYLKAYNKRGLESFPEEIEECFENLDFIRNNNIWQPFGQKGKWLLKREHFNEILNSNYEEQYFNYFIEEQTTITAIINFFDIYFSQSIYKNQGGHLWIYYYHRFVKVICENTIINDKYIDWNEEFPTNGTYLIGVIERNVYEYFSEIYEAKSEKKIIIVCELIVQIISEICNSDNLGSAYKMEQMNILIELYFENSYRQDHENISSSMKENFIRNFLKPPFDRNNEFKKFMKKSWTNPDGQGFDKVTIDDEELRKDFQNQVINKL